MACVSPSAAKVIYVDANAPGPTHDGSSWANAYKYLQDALADAGSAAKPVEIRVAQGIYSPDSNSANTNGSGDRYATFQLINSVTLKGGYVGFGQPEPNERDIELYESILSGDLNGNDTDANSVWDLWGDPTRYDNSFHVVTGSGTDDTAVLEGFTISDGYADGTGIDSCGAGMFNDNGNPTLANCTVYANFSGVGAGMSCEAGNSELTNCTFKMNFSSGIGGGIDICNCSPTLTGCVFIANASHNGGGMSNRFSSPNLINCTFYANEAGSVGGAMCTDLSSPVMSNCTFRENTSGIIAGGMFLAGGSPILTNCVFIKNSALTSSGGAMVNGGIDLTLTNCTFSGNSAMSNSVMQNAHSTITLTNCILWNNTPPQIGDYNSTSMATYSDIEGGWPGLGNIDADPCFADANNSDYHLRADSLCINAGDPNYVAAPNEVDLDGKERVLGGRIDMGAYEYMGPTIYVDANAPGANDGTSWEDAFHFLQDALADAGSAARPVEILIAQGTYKPDQSSPDPNGSGDRYATFQLINDVAIQGGYAGFGEPDPNKRDIEVYETILSGDLAGNDVEVERPHYLHDHPSRVENSYHVVTGSGTDETAIIDGFSITGGKAEGSYPHYIGGGGMYSNSGSHMVTNCMFTRNSSFLFGGGMFNYKSSPILANCTFNINDGGGMENDDSSPGLIQCVFNHNTGSGMSNYNSDITVTNCIFTGNIGVRHGGGIYNDHSIATITNCTISSNKAGGLYNWHNSSSILMNCILWDNTPDQINGDIPTVTYSNVQGGWAGLGNINTDPCFVLPGYWDVNGTPGDQRDDFWVNGDVHLNSQAGRWDPNSESWIRDDVTSPCIDAGNPGCPEANEPIPNGNRRNMGAYGGTAEASKSPAYWRSIADMTNDWIVDSDDLKVYADYWLQTGECIPSDFDRSRSADFNDFAIFGGQWRQTGPGPGITYDMGSCIPVYFASSTSGEFEPTRFTVTVEGQYVLFEDMMRANCCPEELDVQMTLEADLITIYEIERFFTQVPCPCLCDFPITATLGPFEPGTYTLDVYEDETFIGTTNVTIAPGS